MNCYNCGRPFGEHETVEMSQKYMDDNKLSTWDGKRDYPNGLCHNNFIEKVDTNTWRIKRVFWPRHGGK